jgi:hypothetical protein
MEPTERSETTDFNIQTPGKYPEENIPKQRLFPYTALTDWLLQTFSGIFLVL